MFGLFRHHTFAQLVTVSKSTESAGFLISKVLNRRQGTVDIYGFPLTRLLPRFIQSFYDRRRTVRNGVRIRGRVTIRGIILFRERLRTGARTFFDWGIVE